ncbi:MAG: CDP-alcohol phosphatidyltransferase family protein [Ignavibacteriales bacterium]|nr:CDP-alcohol phosphatidyltransferase family protein [Ignavibacteriales bacterium]
MYNYRQSIKSDASDEVINTYLLRPIAGVFVKVLYNTPVTPNQVTIASTIAGLVAAVFYLQGQPQFVAAAGLMVTLKDILDSVDGQLARAKNQYTRTGRFLDSIGDFVADVAIFGAIGWMLFIENENPIMLVWTWAGLTGITLRVSYHVFYHTSFLHLEQKYSQNRLIEEVLDEDLQGDPLALRLQRVFQIIYGWQDRLILRLDEWCRDGNREAKFLQRWYSDVRALRLSGFLGFGTELFLLMVCSVFNELELYLFLNVFVMNGVLAACVLYRRIFLRSGKISAGMRD